MDPSFGKTLVSDDMLRVQQADVSTGGPSKPGLLNRAAARHELQEEFLRAKSRVSEDEFDNLISAIRARGLDPQDVHLRPDGSFHNVMLHEGRATIPDVSAVRPRGGDPTEFLESGGRFIEPAVVDATGSRPRGERLTDAILAMIFDPITAATGHRARTRAAAAGMDPGIYGSVMPYMAPIIPPALRTGRSLYMSSEEEPDVLGPL